MSAPGEVKREERLVPLYVSVPLMVLSLAYAAVMARLGWHGGDPDWRGIVAGAPWVGMWVYGALVLLVEWSHVDVDANGVSVYYTPLPCGVKRRRFGREEIRELTLDEIRVPREGTYWRIGVGLTDGEKVLLPERHVQESVARERVAAIQEVLAGGVRKELPVGTIWGQTMKRNWQGGRGVLLWGGGFLAAIIWGLGIELTRLHR